MKEKISVIVPAYNASTYLEKCINSILNQKYENIELIIVNDGSTDNTLEICEEYADKDNRVIVINQNNSGASTARNNGLKNASGDYITFVDSDDYIDDKMYSTMISCAIKNDAQIVQCGVVRESSNGYTEVWNNSNNIVAYEKQDWLKQVGRANGILPVVVWNKIYEKSILKGIFFDTTLKYAEDTLFNFEVANNVTKVIELKDVFYHYRNNDSSLSHELFSLSRLDEHIVMDRIFSLAGDNDELLKYCIAGDIYKSFRTIREMMTSGNHVEHFPEIRERIVVHKNNMFNDKLYGRKTKIKFLLLWIFPKFYKLFISKYGKITLKKYNNKTHL